MRYPQIVVFERGRRIASALQDFAQRRRWPLREVRRPSTCLELLQENARSVLVLKVGRHLEEELALLATVTAQVPDAHCVVVGEEGHAPLAGSAWDLGAAYVFLTPYPRDWLPAAIEGLLSKEQPRDSADTEEEAS